jgi:uncharacterized membrane protein YeaQ/YmgE (transglycosylase-associated protein family)
MGIISWIILGGVAGWVASRMIGRGRSMGLVVHIIVGIIGAFLGGFLANLVGRNDVISFNLESFFVAVLGAVVFLAVLRAIRS